MEPMVPVPETPGVEAAAGKVAGVVGFVHHPVLDILWLRKWSISVPYTRCEVVGLRPQTAASAPTLTSSTGTAVTELCHHLGHHGRLACGGSNTLRQQAGTIQHMVGGKGATASAAAAVAATASRAPPTPPQRPCRRAERTPMAAGDSTDACDIAGDTVLQVVTGNNDGVIVGRGDAVGRGG